MGGGGGGGGGGSPKKDALYQRLRERFLPTIRRTAVRGAHVSCIDNNAYRYPNIVSYLSNTKAEYMTSIYIYIYTYTSCIQPWYLINKILYLGIYMHCYQSDVYLIMYIYITLMY